MASSKGKPQPNYSDAFKAKAVARLLAEGYPDKTGALGKVAKDLGVSHPTLSRWASGVGVSKEVIEAAVFAAEATIEQELESILLEMEKKRPKADYRTLAIAFGILADKWLLLQGKPTRRTEQTVRDFRSRSTAELEQIVAEGKKRAKETMDELTVPVHDGGSGASEEGIVH